MKPWLFLLVLVVSAPAMADELTWIRLDAPPYYILQGPLAGQGIADRITKLLADALPEYTHRFDADFPVTRIAALQKEGAKVAMVTVLYSKEKEDYLSFSLPTIINPPYALVTSTKAAARFGTSPSLSLRDLLKLPNVTIGVADRVYGEPIDGILKANADNPNLVRRMGTNVFTSLLKMVDSGRVDFVIGTPYEVAYARASDPDDQGVYTYGLEEVADRYLLAYAAFPKTPWGLALRDKVNQVLLRQRQTEAYRALFTDWLDRRSAERLRAVWPKLMETN